MKTKQAEQKKTSGRPVKNIIEPIDALAGKVAKAIMQAPPKKKWDYLKNK